MLMTPQEFIAKYLGKKIDYDNAYGPQCKDLFSLYNDKVVGAPYVVGHAKSLWHNFDKSSTLKKYYTKVNNTITAVPRLGDVPIWDGWYTNPYGHAGVCTEKANIIWFESMDQNWSKPVMCKIERHNYLRPRVLGWLRPKRLA